MEYLAIGLGGMLGANARYLVGGWVTHRLGLTFPWGTFLVNISGSLVLGFFVSYLLKYPTYHYPRLFFAIGFLGAYTTFSTFSVESFQLLENERFVLAFTYILGSAMLGVLGAWSGFTLGQRM